MSERILKALMQLFAIIANPKSSNRDRRPIVESFLEQQLNRDLVDEYLKIFDLFYITHQQKFKSSASNEKITSASSVKVLTICTEINKELTQKQKLIVVIRLLEFINTDKNITQQENEFVTTVSDTFNIDSIEYQSLRSFVLKEGEIEQSDRILLINSRKKLDDAEYNHHFIEMLSGQIVVYALKSANMHIFTFDGENELYLNNQLLDPNKVHILSSGASIKNAKIKPLYYSDIISAYSALKLKSKIAFEAYNISYKFRNGSIGLHRMNFIKKSGKLIGIIGASGSGKSTLLNVLNGNLHPHTGKILINGIDIHNEPKKIEGTIGYVSQDDMLMEELTVFQNLYFSARLSYSNYNRFQILRLVFKLLKNLGLYEIKHLKVGSPMDKKISGGQRKRLNIALELIREPAILFLDEPTSGLSSRDSENILDILKEIASKGKLVFIVIHQPSSGIFKRFDQLMVLDKGGYLIYDGDPVESISYFKSRIRQADWNESECSVCGNVNPEQIFDMVEAQVVDEYGNLTQTRKVQPLEWYEKYNASNEKAIKKSIFVRELPEITFKIPGKLKQLHIYITRDVLSKLTNRQYLLINLLEAPILALILSYITRYYNIDPSNEHGYYLMDNTNLPVYIFMLIIVALFLGMTLSAQEIIKDRMVLKRESFLNLSWTSYLLSKILILAFLSAYQSLSLVLIGNSIMGIYGMFFEYWLVVFVTFIASNLIGLIISDSFKTSVAIYIIIPFLIIPQIILSGVIIKFDNINPAISSPNKIPFYGEIMISRWAYEALAVNQFKENKYQKLFYGFDKERSGAEFKKDYWLKTLENKINYYQINKNDSSRFDKIQSDFEVLQNELRMEMAFNKNVRSNLNLSKINRAVFDSADLHAVNTYFKNLREYYNNRYNAVIRLKDAKILELQQGQNGKEAFRKLKRDYSNDRLSEFVRNSDEINYIKEYHGNLYQKIDPIYLDSKSRFIKAHFYAPKKQVFGKQFDTIWVNIVVLATMSVLLYICLYYKALSKVLDLLTILKQKRNRRETETFTD
jgi:ABC transport system ATP-binding/permease protein